MPRFTIRLAGIKVTQITSGTFELEFPEAEVEEFHTSPMGATLKDYLYEHTSNTGHVQRIYDVVADEVYKLTALEMLLDHMVD